MPNSGAMPSLVGSPWRHRVCGIALAVLTASGAAASELRVGVPRLPATADPAEAVGGPELAIVRLVFQGLVEFGERGEIEPVLAREWAVSRDGLTWTFRVRPGVQLHHGLPLTASDVVASLTRQLSNDEPSGGSPPWARLFRGGGRLVRDIRTGEAETVLIELGQPYAPLLAVLAHPALAIAVTRRDGDVRFFGTGPYRWAEQAPGRLVLEAAAEARGEHSRSARLVFFEVADDAAGAAGLGGGGTLDAYIPQAPPTWGGLGLQVLTAPSWRLGLLVLRSDQGVLSRKAVRQAIPLALDPGLVRPALGRWAVPWSGYLPPGAWAVREARSSHDPVRARRLLAQAGALDGRVTLLVPEAWAGPDRPRLAEAIRLSLATAGLAVKIRVESEEVAQRVLRQGGTELALQEVTLPANDPHFMLPALLAADAVPPGGLTNVAFFRSPLVDGMLLRASQLGFRPERLRLYQRLQAHVAEEMPYVTLYARAQWLLARPTVRGLKLDPGGLHRLERAWVEVPPEPPAPPTSETPAVPPPPPAPAVPVPPSPSTETSR